MECPENEREKGIGYICVKVILPVTVDCSFDEKNIQWLESLTATNLVKESQVSVAWRVLKVMVLMMTGSPSHR